jgi:hypothetical protein
MKEIVSLLIEKGADINITSETILAEFLIRKCELEGGIVSSIIIDRH